MMISVRNDESETWRRTSWYPIIRKLNFPRHQRIIDFTRISEILSKLILRKIPERLLRILSTTRV